MVVGACAKACVCMPSCLQNVALGYYCHVYQNNLIDVNVKF